MRLNRGARYAVHALAHMAKHKGDGASASHIVAREEGIPDRFLLKVLKPLVTARVLTSVRGPNGGYRLAKPPDKITLLEVVEAVEGPLRGDASPFGGAQ